MADKLENFIATIYSDAEGEGSALGAELARKRDAFISAAEDELIGEVAAYIRAASARIRTEAGRRVSQKLFEQKHELYRCRRAIRDEAVNAARKRVEAYTETAEYAAALERLAVYASKKLGGDTMTIYLRAKDMEFAEKLAELSGAKVLEGEVELGGLVAVNLRRHLRLDLSYDSALEKAADDFGEMTVEKA